MSNRRRAHPAGQRIPREDRVRDGRFVGWLECPVGHLVEIDAWMPTRLELGGTALGGSSCIPGCDEEADGTLEVIDLD